MHAHSDCPQLIDKKQTYSARERGRPFGAAVHAQSACLQFCLHRVQHGGWLVDVHRRVSPNLSQARARGIDCLGAAAGFPSGHLCQHSSAGLCSSETASPALEPLRGCQLDTCSNTLGQRANLSKALVGGIDRLGAIASLPAGHLCQHSRAGRNSEEVMWHVTYLCQHYRADSKSEESARRIQLIRDLNSIVIIRCRSIDGHG